MATFAERMGYEEIRSLTQNDSLDDETRVALWNVMDAARKLLNDAWRMNYEKTLERVTSSIWAQGLKRPADEEPSGGIVWGHVKRAILQGTWVEALDMIEKVVRYTESHKESRTHGAAKQFAKAYNLLFERYLVGFRFIGLEISPLDTTAASDAVVAALEDTSSIQGARHHLERAVALLADRQSPDYPNSIKESISAVEAVCVAVTGGKTLGEALTKLKSAGVRIHPALEQAWSKMYGWTSDANGIRHGSIESPDADQAIAKYMLIACSGFVSHIIEVGRKAQLI